MSKKIKEKLVSILQELNKGLVEREEVLKITLLALLAGENILLVGPPGTGKSLISRRVSSAIGNQNYNDYFEYLLTKFSTPEELFGPLSIADLKADRFNRKTDGYLPSVKVAFLDEIFKANSSILNSLLTIMNEKVFHNGLMREEVPLQSIIAASNELPTNQDELTALYDRLLLRYFVDYVKESNLKKLFYRQEEVQLTSLISHGDLNSVKAQVNDVKISEGIIDIVTTIWLKSKERFSEDSREQLSDRRLKKVIDLLCVSAITNDRNEVDLSDVLILKHCLWNHPDNAEQVSKIILDELRMSSLNIKINNQDFEHNTNEVNVEEDVAAIKGLKGAGTENSPILIENVNDLYRLSEPSIGKQGYHFKQVNDIDCKGITPWMEIEFKGHYNGSGKTISYPKDGELCILNRPMGLGFFGTTASRPSLFNKVGVDSTITNLTLKELLLTDVLIGSKVTNCSSNWWLFNECSNSLITQSLSSLGITYRATNCKIYDCAVLLDNKFLNYSRFLEQKGAIAYELEKNTEVKRCYVGGDLEVKAGGKWEFTAISYHTKESKVEHCAIGQLKLTGDSIELVNNIAVHHNDSEFKKNIVRASTTNKDKFHDGCSIPVSQFNQRYLQDVLDWDFESIWQWNESSEHPSLRMIESKHQISIQPQANLLAEQIKQNIWL